MKSSNENLKVSFYLKKNNTRNGLCPVMGSITIGKDVTRFSCKLDANPTLWDTCAGRMNGKSAHARTVNREIDKINVAINARYKEIVSTRGEVTVEEVKHTFQGISASQETLLQVFREHNDVYRNQAGVNYSVRTWKNHDNSRNNLVKFIKYKYHVFDFHFRQLNRKFIDDYAFYLRIDRKLSPCTTLKSIDSLRKVVKIAIRRKIISADPFFGFSPEYPKPCQRYVPENELKKIMKTSLNNASLEVTRDMFVFSCFTGLAYIDLYNLTNSHIIKDEGGLLWLNINRQKTGSVSKIPLLDVPLQLIEKYRKTNRGNDKVFPMKRNDLMNEQLKKVAILCGVERRLTFHMARHTFATETCLSQGVPIETVSRMMGHTKLSTTQIYAKVTHNKINEDMALLSEKISDKYVFAL